ncbi:MAG TPA: Fur family transcriptional regulator [Segeticoccus sp.]|nr:Fur family transcriptional regulator [Segeticoccus sp.]
MRDIGQSLRQRGMRMTAQRRRILDVVSALGHSTPDAIAGELEKRGEPVPPSTIYRTLEALEGLGVVTHTHLGHGSPTWHLAEHADHLHLVCQGCGRVVEADVAVTEGLTGNLSERYGFVADVRHLAVHGWCAACRHRRNEQDDQT